MFLFDLGQFCVEEGRLHQQTLINKTLHVVDMKKGPTGPTIATFMV